MLKTLLHWHRLRTNCIINIYFKSLSTKTKGHTTSKSTSIFPTKDDISILKKIKKGKPLKKISNGDSPKNIKLSNGMNKNRKSNLKIFSLLENGSLMTDSPTDENQLDSSKAAVKSRIIPDVNTCSAMDYAQIIAATKSNTEDMENYEKYQEDCQSETDRLRGFRKWSSTNLGHNYREQYENSSLFTIVSYNILAQNLLEAHMYLYRSHDPRALTWSHRVQRVLDEIVTHNAEIICLQEVQEDHIEYITKRLAPLNYKNIYKKRTLNHTDGSAIFYKSNVFSLLDYRLVEYFRPNSEILSRGNVGIVAKFKLKDAHSGCSPATTDGDIVVATTHLLYNPRRNDVRLAQTQLMLAELDRMAYVGIDKNGLVQYLPIILTGDFNLQPHTAVYDLVTKGVLQYSNLSYKVLEPLTNGRESAQNEVLPPEVGVSDNCQYLDIVIARDSETSHKESWNKKQRMNSGLLLHSLNFTSSYSHFTNNTLSQASTYQNEWVTVDYIFYSHGSTSCEISTGHLNLLARLDLPTVPECDFMGQIPNLVFGSDHLLLAAKFLYRR